MENQPQTKTRALPHTPGARAHKAFASLILQREVRSPHPDSQQAEGPAVVSEKKED